MRLRWRMRDILVYRRSDGVEVGSLTWIGEGIKGLIGSRWCLRYLRSGGSSFWMATLLYTSRDTRSYPHAEAWVGL